MVGEVCDPSHLLIMFDLRVIGLGDEVVGDITSLVDMHGGGDKGHRRRVGVFGCKKCPTVSGSFILRCISGVKRMW